MVAYSVQSSQYSVLIGSVASQQLVMDMLASCLFLWWSTVDKIIVLSAPLAAMDTMVPIS